MMNVSVMMVMMVMVVMVVLEVATAMEVRSMVLMMMRAIRGVFVRRSTDLLPRSRTEIGRGDGCQAGQGL